MTVVELLQVINDESLSPQLRLEAAKAALPFCQDDETDDDERRDDGT